MFRGENLEPAQIWRWGDHPQSSMGIKMQLTSIIKLNCTNNYNVQCSQRTQSATL